MGESQTFTALGATEEAWLSNTIARVDALSREIAGEGLDAGPADAFRLDAILASGRFGPDDTEALQALGIAFCNALLDELDGFAWWTVEDSFGRDPCLRYRETSLVLFPRSMLSKRVEDGEEVNVPKLFTGLQAEVARILGEGVS